MRSAPKRRVLGQDVDIVPMRRRHLRSVLRIEAKVYPLPWTVGLFMSELSQRDSRAYYVAKAGSVVIGYAGIMLVEQDAHVTTIAVDPAFHRRSVGTRLLLNAVRVALANGARHLTLEVRVTNYGAQALYRRFGFQPVGIRRNYYAETGEDALVMWARDIDTDDYGRRLAQIEADLKA